MIAACGFASHEVSVPRTPPQTLIMALGIKWPCQIASFIWPVPTSLSPGLNPYLHSTKDPSA